MKITKQTKFRSASTILLLARKRKGELSLLDFDSVFCRLAVQNNIMALVAYDNSDSSEYEDEDSQYTPIVELINKPKSNRHLLTFPS